MDEVKSKPNSSKRIVTDYQKAHKRAERERSRLAKEHQRELERKKKILEKEKQQRQRQEKKDAEEREKEEKRLKRREEQRKKEEERECERKKKEEEKRKKEEERLQKEQERKKEEELKIQREEKQRAVLLGFLVKSENKKETSMVSGSDCGPFIKFEVRKDMKMAPLHRMSQSLLYQKRNNIDNLRSAWIEGSNRDTGSSLGLLKFGRANYLHELRTGQIMPLSYPSTWPIEPPNVHYLGDNMYLPINSAALKQHGNRGGGGTVWLRAKLFQFTENYRPAYYGTWRRRSRIVTGRRPFARDDYQLDYSADSDDEWEEEEPGESITQSDNEEEEEEEEKEEDDDEDDDDNFLVPHGYLSDDEGVAAEEGEGPIPDEMKQLRQQLSVAEYEAAHRRGLQRLKPLLIGPLWLPEPVECIPNSTTNIINNQCLEENKENIELSERCGINKQVNEKTEFQLMKSVLSIYRVFLWTPNLPISVEPDIIASTPSRRLKKSLPEEAMPYFIHLVHRSHLGKHKLAFEFRVFWHRHTTGSLPECLQYMEYKRHNASAMGSSVSRGAVLSGPAWDNLPLSQYLVLSKLAEIAVFAEGKWMVNPGVLQKYASRLCSVCNIQELGIVEKVDKDYLNSFTFPSWQYLTDVAATSTRVSRVPINRRSVELPAATDCLVESDQNGVLNNDSPLTVPQPAQPLSSPSVMGPLRQTEKESTHRQDRSVLSNKVHASEKDASLSTSISQENGSSKVTSLSQTPGRKRVTLDSFLIPPAKRLNNVSSEISSENDCHIIDSKS